MRWPFVSGALAIVLLLVPSLAAEAQSTPCALASDAVVSSALGEPVQGTMQANVVAGLDFCDFIDAAGTDFSVSHESNAFGPGEGGPAALALRYIPQLSDAMRAQISAFNQAGINFTAPGYDVSTITGVGDAAISVKFEPVPGIVNDSLIVQRGGDGFSFNMDDSPDASTKLKALAQAVLANSNP